MLKAEMEAKMETLRASLKESLAEANAAIERLRVDIAERDAKMAERDAKMVERNARMVKQVAEQNVKNSRAVQRYRQIRNRYRSRSRCDSGYDYKRDFCVVPILPRIGARGYQTNP